MTERHGGAIALGTSSWQFDGWRGSFYPQGLAARDQLAYYVSRFPTVEVNTSFYAIPRESTVARWRDTAPDGFSYCLKFPRVITHDKELVDCEEETQLFLDRLTILGNHAAPAFLQFPARVSRARNGRQLAAYLDWLALQVGDRRIGVEVRAPDLHTEAFARFVAERGFTLLLVDRVDTPDLFDLWLDLVEAGTAPDFAVIRWIGDDVNGPQGDRTLTDPRDADLLRWRERLIALAAAGVDLYGYMHNPYEGHSPASVHRLQALLREKIDLPDWSPPAPALPAPGSAEDDAGQLPLFE